jgi:RHS repeat-associated protein
LGNVLAVVSDELSPFGGVGGGEAVVVSATDYYAFGQEMVGRTFASPFGGIQGGNDYRYGFNGKENDREWGESLIQDYGMRLYNPALCRFLSVDPLYQSYPWNSTYAFAEDNPIRFIDLDGLEKANPEIFDLAILAIAQARLDIVDTDSNKSVIKDVGMVTILTELENQVTAAMTKGCSDVKTNYMGYYCGKSALHNLMILYNPLGYVTFMVDLCKNGKATFGDGGLTISVPEELSIEGLQYEDGNHYSDPSLENREVIAASEIFGKSINSSTQDKSLVRKIVQGIDPHQLNDEGNTIPFEYKRLLGATGMKTRYASFYCNYGKKDIERIKKAIDDNYIPVIFENHGITYEGHNTANTGDSGKFGIHFVTLHALEIEGDSVKFQFFEYGELKTRTKTIEEFAAGMKGYWIPENKSVSDK